MGEAGIGVLQKYGVALDRRERRIDLALGGAGLEFAVAVLGEKAALLIAEPVMIVVKIHVLRENGQEYGDALFTAEFLERGDGGELLVGLRREERAVGLREAGLHIDDQQRRLLRVDRKGSVPLPISCHDTFPPLYIGLLNYYIL